MQSGANTSDRQNVKAKIADTIVGIRKSIMQEIVENIRTFKPAGSDVNEVYNFEKGTSVETILDAIDSKRRVFLQIPAFSMFIYRILLNI